jgi:serine phosphatase RsbU (regulator of sigma subunit)
MKDEEKHRTALRIGVALLASMLVAIAAVTFYTMASIPTDENIFMTAPSTIVVREAVPARAEGLGRPRSGEHKDGSLTVVPDSLLSGDLLIAAADKPVRSFKALQPLLSRHFIDSIHLRVYRPRRDAYFSYAISPGLFTADLFQERDSVVIVVDVLPGGASDRAGMKIGDVIVRINGKRFKDAQEADANLRRGTSGAPTFYDIERGGQPASLPVTLARFGFPLPLLALWLSGLCYIAFGSLLVFRRPDLVAARTLGFMFLLIGFVTAVAWIKREPDPTWFTRSRDVLLVLAGFLGTAAGFHASGVFPVERRKPVFRKWITPALYGVALLSPLTLLAGSSAFPWVILANFVIAATVAKVFGLTKLTPPQKRIVRPVRIVVIVVVVLSFVMAPVFGVLGIGGIAGLVGILLLLIPLSYAYVIGRYRLMGMDFRIRRNVQYTLLSWIWGILLAILFVRLLVAIPGIPLHVPGIVISGLSVEIDPTPSSPDQQEFLERLVMMVIAVVLWYVLWRVRRAGQQLIDRKYYRTQFDYRRAATALSEVLATRLSMNDIARGSVDTLSDLLKLKRVGLLVFRNGEECCCDAVAGLEREEWQRIACAGDREFAAALSAVAEPVRSELLNPDIRALLTARDFQSVVPIRSKDRLVGALLVGEKLSETPLGAEDLSFLSGVANQMSVAIENAFLYEELAGKERMQHELNIARRIQVSSLPSTTPLVPGLDIAGMSSPALEVGGDFFDYLDGTGEDLMVIVGDVSGKGTSAALYMAKVQGVLRSLHGFGLTPRELFVRANRLLCKDLEKSSFVTALGAHFPSGVQRLTLVRAGHVPLYFYHAKSASVEQILPRGLGLGLNDAGVFAREIEERVVGYAPGDAMVFVTDGVLEARSTLGEEFGEHRISALLSRNAHLGAAALRDVFVEEIQRFGEGADQHDDQTIVVVKAV